MRNKTIIALCCGIFVPFLIIMALVTRLFVHRHSKTSKQDIYTLEGNSSETDQQHPRRSKSWKHLFGSKQKDASSKWVPTLSAIVKAGDEGLWSSALFTSPHGHPGEVSFEAICEMFANELRPRSMTERSAYSGEIGKFITSTRQGANVPRRVQSLSHRRTASKRGDVAPSTQRRSLDIASIEKTLGRGLSVKRPAPNLISMGNGLFDPDSTSPTQQAWMKEGRPAEQFDSRIGVKLTSAEFAALSILLGSSIVSPLDDAEVRSGSFDEGAFGIAIKATTPKDGRRMVSLQRRQRNVSQLPSGGSGHSPLFAKHLACGSLPFSQDATSISTIMITDDSLQAVRAGSPLTMRKRAPKTTQTALLAALPSSHEPTFFAIEASTKSSPPTPLIDAIAQLPFLGGLTPLASAPMIETIHFVASGGVHPGRLLQRLEGLVDKVQRHSPHLDIFGPLHHPQNAGLLFREREQLGKITSGIVTENLADKVSRMHRYTTLLQRLMALIPDIKPQDALAAVREATKQELLRSYLDAVVTHNSPSPSPISIPSTAGTSCPEADARGTRQRHTSSSSRRSARRSPRSSVGSGTATSHTSRLSTSFPTHNLGKQIETLLKSELPFSVRNVAQVARLVLVAWTLSVGTVAWEEGEEGFRVPDLKKRADGEIVFV